MAERNQEELDTSWAVIGEVYGRYQGLNGLGLVIRRIRSNLDDRDEFARRVGYIPRRAAFEAAGADLLKLLIAPLYGNRPIVGVRELMQNALDAVLERREVTRQRGEVESLFSNQDVSDSMQLADVTVEVTRDESGVEWLVVRDSGIGMDVDVITAYFLRAGASFRQSQEWHNAFEDQDGHSRVRRSGRFGVGALSAFLLGPEIRVVTRHIDQKRGISFAATVDTDAVQLERVDAPFGTTVKVRLAANIAGELGADADQWNVAYQARANRTSDWDWYCLADPVVERRLWNKPLNQRYSLPNAGETLQYPWRRIHHEDFEDVQWSYAGAPSLVCNGLVVRNMHNDLERLWDSRTSSYSIAQPGVSVFDRDGLLPLNLQRDALASVEYPFQAELQSSVAEEVLAWLVVFGPERPPFDAGTITSYLKLQHAAIRFPNRVRGHSAGRVPLFFTESGFSFSDEWSLSRLGSRSILLLPFERDEQLVPNIRVDRDFVAVVEPSTPREATFRGWIRYALGGSDYGDLQESRFPLKRDLVVGRRVILPSVDAGDLNQVGRFPALLRAAIHEEWQKNGWTLWRVGTCPESNVDFERIASAPPLNAPRWRNIQAVAEWYTGDIAPVEPFSPIATTWASVVGQTTLSYDPSERRKQVASAPTIVKYLGQHEIRQHEMLERAKQKKKARVASKFPG